MTRRALVLTPLWFAPLILAGSACHADPAAEAAYAQLNNRLSAVKSLTGSLELTVSGDKSTYTFKLLRPNYSSIISDEYEAHGDGKTEWGYMPKSSMYTQTEATSEMAPFTPLIGFEAMNPTSKTSDFTLGNLYEATFAGKHCTKLILTPKDDKTQTRRLYIDDTGLPAGWQWEMSGPDPKGPRQQIIGVYRDLQLDVPLEPGAFAWKPPVGATKFDYTAKLLKAGTVAPTFTLKTPEGTNFSLASALKRNKATLLNFWSYG